MCNKKKARYIFNTSDVAYIDACTIMNVDRIEKFFERYGELLEKAGITIIIPSSVRRELIKLTYSDDCVKRIKSENCIEYLTTHPGLFEIEGGDLTGEDIDWGVHADPEIIAMLTLGRRRRSQLLLTNDCDLAEDVCRLNNLRSCVGKPITTCYIDNEGYLQVSQFMGLTIEDELAAAPAEIRLDEPLADQEPVPETPAAQPVEEGVQTSDERAEAPENVPTLFMPEESGASGNKEDSRDVGVFAFTFAVGMLAAGIAGNGVRRHSGKVLDLAKRILKKAS